MNNIRNAPIVKHLLNVLEDSDTWLAAFFFAVAAFASYTQLIAPEFRSEAVLGALAAAVASATGVRGVLLAYAQKHAATIVGVLDDTVNYIEHEAGVNFVNDDLQRLIASTIRKELAEAKVDSETQRKLEDLERKIASLMSK
jgi:hypothetical protein